MKIYLINFILILIYAMIYGIARNRTKYADKLKLILFTVSIMQLIAILAFRHYTIGVDVKNYKDFFEGVCYKNDYYLEQARYEVGYKALMYVISIFTDNLQVVLAIIALLSIVPVGVFIYKNSEMPFLSLLLYMGFNFYAFVFSGLRQAIAISFIIWSFKFIKERKIIKYAIMIICAICFHKSAFVFIPAYFLYNVKLNKNMLIGICIVDVLIFIFKSQIVNLFIRFFYESYSVSNLNAKNWLLLNVAIIAVTLLFYKKTINNNKENNLLYMLSIVGVSLMLFSSVSGDVLRIANYYYIFVIALIPKVIKSIEGKYLKTIVSLGFTFGMLPLYIYLLNVDAYQIVPYQFF